MNNSTEKNKTKCCAEVTYYIGAWPYHKQCKRPGIFEIGGKLYCHQHNPNAVKEREEKREKKYQTELGQRKRQWAAINACSELTIEQIEAIPRLIEWFRSFDLKSEWIVDNDIREIFKEKK